MPKTGFLEFALAKRSFSEQLAAEKKQALTEEQKVSLRVAIELISEAGKLVSRCKENDSIGVGLADVNESLLTFEFFVFLSTVFVEKVKNSEHVGSSSLSTDKLIEAMLGPAIVGAEIADRFIEGNMASKSMVRRDLLMGTERSCIEMLSRIDKLKRSVSKDQGLGNSTFSLSQDVMSSLLGILNSYLSLDGKEKIAKTEQMFLQLIGASKKTSSYKSKSVSII